MNQLIKMLYKFFLGLLFIGIIGGICFLAGMYPLTSLGIFLLFLGIAVIYFLGGVIYTAIHFKVSDLKSKQYEETDIN